MTTLPPEPEYLPPTPASSSQRTHSAYDRISEVDCPELWITLRPKEDVLVEAKAVDERVRAGESLPLAGLLLAVTDVVDIAGLPTTAGRAAYTHLAEQSATAVNRLTAAGAVVLGKTGPDRFTTALELVDLAIGTAGAATLAGTVGITATRGLVPKTGLVPASRTYDSVTVFARTLATARLALAEMIGPDGTDPSSRDWPASVRLGAGEHPRVAIPGDAVITALSGDARRAFRATVQTLRCAGLAVETLDLAPFQAAGSLLDDGVLVAGQERLDGLRAAASALFSGFDALLLPSASAHPAFVPVLDLAAVAVPVGTADGGPFGISLITRAFDDQIAIDLAALLLGEPNGSPYPATGIDLVVFGAHLRGQPLNAGLVALGARFSGEVLTTEEYRMVALRPEPDHQLRPGIVRTGEGGTALEGERWTISPAGLGRFVAELPAPLSLGRIALDGGGSAVGVLCDPSAETTDITKYGGWRAYLRFLVANRLQH